MALTQDEKKAKRSRIMALTQDERKALTVHDGVMVLPEYDIAVAPSFRHVDIVSMCKQEDTEEDGPLHGVIDPLVATDFAVHSLLDCVDDDGEVHMERLFQLQRSLMEEIEEIDEWLTALLEEDERALETKRDARSVASSC